MATENWKKENQEKMREYRRKYYNKNKDSEKKRITERRKELHKFIKDYKHSGIKCIRCGEDHPATLQFHHRDPNDKKEIVSVLATRGCSLDIIKEEINKCDVLCANCHFKLHYNEKYGISSEGE